MFYDKFFELCIKNGLSPSAAAINAGFSNAAAAGWKKGAVPRRSAIKRLAGYFGVPEEYFSEESAEETKVASTPEAEVEDIMKIYGMLTPERQKQARVAIADLLKDQLQE